MNTALKSSLLAFLFTALLVASMAPVAQAASFSGGVASDLVVTPLPDGTVRLEFRARPTAAGVITYDIFRIVSTVAPGSFTGSDLIASGIADVVSGVVVFNNTTSFPPLRPTFDGTPYYYGVRANETGQPAVFSGTRPATADANDPVAVDDLLATAVPQIATVNLEFENPFDTVDDSEQHAIPSSSYKFDYLVYAKTQSTDLLQADLTGANLANTVLVNNYVIGTATTIQFNGVGGTEYAFGLIIQDTVGNRSTISTGANLGDTRAITSITDLSAVASAIGNESITQLSWSANEASLGSPYRFLVYAKVASSTADGITAGDIAGGTAVLVATQTNDPSNIFFHTGTTPGLPRVGGTLYAYNVIVVDVDGRSVGVDLLSPISNDAFALATDGVPPNCPSNLVAAPGAGGIINLSWTDEGDNPGGSGISHFNIRRLANGGGITLGTAVSATTTLTTFTDSSTVNGTLYCYSVTAVDNDGNESVICNESCAVADADAPTVTNITAVPAIAGLGSTPVITVTVSEVVTVAPTVTVTTAGSGTVAAAFTGVVGTQYSYVYTTLNTETQGAGNASIDVNGTDDSSNAFSASNTTALQFDFTAPSISNIRRTSGLFYQRAGMVGTYAFETSEAVSARTLALGTANTAYVNTVVLDHNFTYTTLGTENQGPLLGNASASDFATPANTANASSATPVVFFDFVAPNAPAGLAGVTGASGTVALTWTDTGDAGVALEQSGVAGWNVYRRPAAGVYALIATVTATAYIDSGTDGVFFYEVTSVDNAGNESAVSNEAGPFSLDSAAPIFTVVATPLVAGVSGDVTLTVTSSEAVLGTPTVVLDTLGSGANAASPLPGATTDTFQFSYTALNTETEGPNAVAVTVTGSDLLGNMGLSTRTDVNGDFLQFDFTAPVLSNLVVTPSAPFLANGGTIGITFDSNELLDLSVNPVDVGGSPANFVSETVNGATDISYAFNFTVGGAPASDGLNTVTAQGQDFAVPANLSNSVTDTVFIDRVDPNSPANLNAVAGFGGVINLTWDDTGDAGPLLEQSGVDFFNVYRSILPSTAVTVLATAPLTVPLGSNGYTDITSVDGVGYFYVVTSVDNAGNESFLAPAIVPGSTATADSTPPVLTIVDADPDVAGLASSVTIEVSANEALIAPPTVTVTTVGSGTNAATFLTQVGTSYFYSYSTFGTETEGQNAVTVDAAANDAAGNLGTESRPDINGDLLVFDFTPPNILSMVVIPVYTPTAVNATGTVTITLVTDEPVNGANSNVTVDGNAAAEIGSVIGAVTSTITFQYNATGAENQGYVPVTAQVADNALQIPNLSAISQVTDQVFFDFRNPNPPSPVIATAQAGGTIGISWTDQGDTGPLNEQSGVVSFNIYREETQNPGFISLGNLAAPASSAGDGGAINGVEYRYAVTSVDAAGNESILDATNTSLPVIADASGPQVVITAVPNPAGFPTDVTLTVAANEAILAPTGLGLTVQTAGSGIVAATFISATTDTATFLYSVSGTETEGPGAENTVVTVQDLVGNVTVASVSDTPIFDFTAPALGPIVITSGDFCAGLGDVITFTFTTDEAIQSATVTFAGLPATLSGLAGPVVNATVTITGAATEGMAEVDITASDFATPANIASVTATTAVCVDLTAPATNTIIAPLDGTIVSGPAVTVDALVADAGCGNIDSTEFFFEGVSIDVDPTDNPGTASVTWDTTLFPDGPGDLQAFTTDCAGNLLASATISVTIDNQPPIVTMVPVEGGCLAGSFVICATAFDAGAGVASVAFYHRDATGTVTLIDTNLTPITPGSTEQRCATFDTISLGIADGPGVLYAVATDLSSGALQATSAEIPVTVDNTAPAVQALAIAIPRGIRSISNGGTPANLSTTATDATSFVAEVTIDLTPIGGSNPAVAMTSAGGGVYELITGATSVVENLYDLIVTATDCAGNAATGTIQLIIDNSAPIADAAGLDARYPAWSVLGQNGFPSGSNDWQYEDPSTWNDNELANPTVWDGTAAANVLVGLLDVLGQAVDNQPPAFPSGLGTVDLYYQQSAFDIVPASRPISNWSHIGQIAFDTVSPVTYTIEFNTGPLAPTNTDTGQDYVFLKTVTTDVAGNTLDPIFGPFIVVDTQAPGPITWLRARSQNGTSDVLLDWHLGGPAPDNGTLAYYEIYRSREPIFSIAGLPVYATEPAVRGNGEDTLTYLDQVPDVGVFWYAILAVDAAGNRDINAFSNTVAASKLDINPPNAITDLLASPGADNSAIALTWTPPIDNVGVSYYNVYRLEQGTILLDSNPNDTVGDLVPTNKIAEVNADLRPTKVLNERAALVGDGDARIVLRSAPLDAASVLSVRNITKNITYAVASLAGKTVTLSVGGLTPAPSVGDEVRVDYLTRQTLYIDTQAIPGHTYAYAVQAVDSAGNLATISTGVSTGATDLEEDTVATAVDTRRPDAIANLVAEDVDATTDVLLQWFTTPFDDAGVASYNIYRSTRPITTLADPSVNRIVGFAPEYAIPASATETFTLATGSFDPNTFIAVDTTRWLVFGQSGLNAPSLAGDQLTLTGIPESVRDGGTFLDNLKFTYASSTLRDPGTGSYAQQLSFTDQFTDAFAPAQVERMTFYYAVTAVDQMGNEALISNTDAATVNDITPPDAPVAALIRLEQNAPDKDDYVFGLPGAGEPGAEVLVYAFLPGVGTVVVTTNNPVRVLGDGSIPRISLGNNVIPEVFLVLRDAAGNTSLPTGSFFNDIVAPPAPILLNNFSEFGRVNENAPGSQDIAQGTVETAGEPTGAVTVRAYREASLNAVISEAVTSNAFAIPIGDNQVDVVYVTAEDAAGNRSAPAIGLNDIVPPDPPNLVTVAANPPGTNDTVSGQVDPDVQTVTIYSNATLEAAALVSSQAASNRRFGPVSIGDNGNNSGIGIVYVTSKDRAQNESNAVSAVNDITSPPVYDVRVEQNFPGTSDLVDVQTEPNAVLDIFSTEVNLTFDSVQDLADGFIRPGGIAVGADGSVYVTDWNGGGSNGTLTRLTLNANGQVTGRTVLITGLVRPGGVAIDPAGNIYVAHSVIGLTAGRIARRTAGGAVNLSYLTPSPFGPDAIGPEIVGPVMETATTFVFTSRTSRTVLRVDTTAVSPVPVRVIGAASRFFAPRALAFDIAGNLYVADDRGGIGQDVITKTDVGGNYTEHRTGLSDPMGMALDVLGNFYVLQMIDGGQRPGVTLIRPSGARRDLYATELPGDNIGPVFDNRDGQGNVLFTSSESDTIYVAPLGASGVSPVLPAQTLVLGRPSDALLFQGNRVADNAGRLLDLDIGDNLVNEVAVIARDAAGNWSAIARATNDSIAPDVPTVNLVMNAPGTNDIVSGQTEPGATVRVYADANLTNLIATTIADRRSGVFTGLFIGDNQYARLWVTAEDRWGNESRATAADNDISTPNPDPLKIIVIENRPGTQDRIFGLFGAVEPFSTVKVYSNDQLTRFLGQGTADQFGAFASFGFGDNSAGEIFLQAVDPAGNKSGVVNFFNDITPPSAPEASRVRVTNNAPGTPDRVEGLKDAIERNENVVLIYAFARANQSSVIPGWPIPANNDGSFGVPGTGFSVGNNYWDAVGLASIGPAGVENKVYLVSEDQAGNRGAALEVSIDASVTILNDPSRFIVTSNEPGLPDNIRALQGSVEPGAQVRFHRFAPPTGVVTTNGLLNTTHASLDGGFDDVPVGDDVNPIFVQLVDAAGNVSNTLAVPNDIVAPNAPDAARIAVLQNPPGKADVIFGRPGAVDTVAHPDAKSVRVYAAPGRRQFLGELPLNGDGSFPQLAIGDNQYFEVFVTALDRSRNESVPSAPVLNDIAPPPAPSVLVTMNAPGSVDLVSGTVPGAGGATTINVPLAPNGAAPVNGPSVSMEVVGAGNETVYTLIGNLAPLEGGFSYEGWVVGSFTAPNETDYISLGKFNVEADGSIVLLDRDGTNPVATGSNETEFGQQGGWHVVDENLAFELPSALLPVDLLSSAGNFVVSIEPQGDNDFEPSDSVLATVQVVPSLTTELRFPQILALQLAQGAASFDTNASGQNDGTIRYTFTNLPELSLNGAPAGFDYEGWVASSAGPVSTGKFDIDASGQIVNTDGSPRSNVFTTAGGVDITTQDVVVITIEPSPDDSPLPSAPYAFRPLSGSINIPPSGDAVSIAVFDDAGLDDVIVTGSISTGSWGPLSIGDNAHGLVWVRSYDAAGNPSAVVIAINDITPPAAPSAAFNQNLPGTQDSVYGFAEIGAVINLFSNQTLTTSAGSGVAVGGIIQSLVGGPIPVGDNRHAQLWVTATDMAGNRSVPTQIFNDIAPPAAPNVNNLNLYQVGNPFEDSLAGYPGAVDSNEDFLYVRVFSETAFSETPFTPATQVVATVANSDGGFNTVFIGNNYWNPATESVVGIERVFVLAEDEFGNRSNAVTVAIDARTQRADRNRIQVNSNPPGSQDTVQAREGAVEGGSNIFIYSATGEVGLIGSGLATSDGSWQPIAIGDNFDPIYLVAVDQAGNKSGEIMLRNQVALPPRPSVNAIVVESNAPGVDDAVFGRSGAVTGVKVRIFANANATGLIGEANVAADGSFARISIGDNRYARVYAAAVDAAGNQSDTVELLNDIASPAVPTVVVESNVPGKNDLVSGAVASDVVSVNVYADPNKSVLIVSGPKVGTGYGWLSIGDNKYAAVYVAGVDAAGNESGVAQGLNDIQAPNTPVAFIQANAPGTNDILNGFAEANSLVTVLNETDGGQSLFLAEVTASAGGTFSLSIGDNAVKRVSLYATDAAGNRSGSVTLENDVTPPAPVDLSAITVLNQPDGNNDQLVGRPGAVTTDTALVRVFSDAGLTTQIAQVRIAGGQTSFGPILIGNDLYNRLYLTTEDLAGNRSAAVELVIGLRYAILDGFGGVYFGTIQAVFTGPALTNPWASDLEFVNGYEWSYFVLAEDGNIYAQGDGPVLPSKVSTRGLAARDLDIVWQRGAPFSAGAYVLTSSEILFVNVPNLGQAPGANMNKALEVKYTAPGQVAGYYVLNELGDIRTFGPVPTLTGPNFGVRLARDLLLASEEVNGASGAWVLAGDGNLVALNGAPSFVTPYFGYDVARKIALTHTGDPADGLYMLDGFGGVHALGKAQPLVGAPYFGWDIARDLEVLKRDR